MESTISIAALKQLIGNENSVINVLGYSVAGDGGGGLFYYDSISTLLDNGGTIIKPTNTTNGRWKRNFNESIDVRWFPGVNLGLKLQAAYNSLPTTGGIIDCSNLVGTHYITQQIIIDKNNVTIIMSNTIVELSGVDAVPGVGSVLLVYGNFFELKGTSSSILKMANGCKASALGIYGTNANVHNMTFNGNKNYITADNRDTWGTAITCIRSSPERLGQANHTFENLYVYDFIHYGIHFYGDNCGGNTVNNCIISSNGNSGMESKGSGFAINRDVHSTKITNCIISYNKNSGIFMCTADGVSECLNNQISNNHIFNNGKNGVWVIEQPDLYSQPGKGTRRLLISNNHIYSNIESGIRIGTYSITIGVPPYTVTTSVGIIENISIVSNHIFLNTLWGVILQGNNSTDSYTKNVTIASNFIVNNPGKGIFIDVNVQNTFITSNKLNTNLVDIDDTGTNTVIAGNILNNNNYFTTKKISSEEILLDNGKIIFNEVGVRSFTAKAESGVVKITSGDGNGVLDLANINGVKLPIKTTANLLPGAVANSGFVYIESGANSAINLIIHANDKRYRITSTLI